jgi:hypothetical protein
VTALEQLLAEVGAEETGAAGDDRGRHRRDGIDGGGRLREPVLDAKAWHPPQVPHHAQPSG